MPIAMNLLQNTCNEFSTSLHPSLDCISLQIDRGLEDLGVGRRGLMSSPSLEAKQISVALHAAKDSPSPGHQQGHTLLSYTLTLTLTPTPNPNPRHCGYRVDPFCTAQVSPRSRVPRELENLHPLHCQPNFLPCSPCSALGDRSRKSIATPAYLNLLQRRQSDCVPHARAAPPSPIPTSRPHLCLLTERAQLLFLSPSPHLSSLTSSTPHTAFHR